MTGRILIADDVATERIVGKARLAAACYHPMTAADGQSCLALARDMQPNLILLKFDLPDIDGLEVLRRLRADPLTCTIPVVMQSDRNDPQSRIAALSAGAVDCLVRPVPDAILMARLRNLMRARESLAELGQRDDTLQTLGLAEAGAPFTPAGHIMLVTERAEVGMRLRKELAPRLSHRLQVLNRAEALSDSLMSVNAAVPDLFLIDIEPGYAGLRLMSELRSRSSTRHAGIVLLQCNATTDDIAMSYDMGAHLVLHGQVSTEEVAVHLNNLIRTKQSDDRLRASVQSGLRLAVIDPLTGLYNRRYALPRLASIAGRAFATQGSFAVMVIDLDRFKAVNDAYGHGAGDTVLVEVSQRLTDNLRASDLVARIGGEEFLVALPDAGLTDAKRTAERLCEVVQAHPIQLRNGVALTVTVSIGLALARPGLPDAQSEAITAVIERADRALLLAKAGGRNQVRLSGAQP
ncbi:diguanylate cyclase [Gemmobacter serpentinus]|uniref:diguanylate cyclase n=1 Tax=Gemmobacter serpentinus TaxID=2652247 RepID=UPI00124DCBEA|nr:diguanylate cyclase [Gemmobacter serpentinus]